MADETNPLDTSQQVATPKEGEDSHKTALRHAEEAWRQEFENIDKGRDDQRFYAGEQWPADAAQQRQSDNRPVLTINRLPGFVHQLTGDVRQNTPSIKVLPARGDASKAVAKVYNGLIRNIEQQSDAKSAYVKAIENAAICGIGHWRIRAAYSSDDRFDQDLRIERINDPFAVLRDPMALKADKSDGRYAFIFQDVVKEEYERLFPSKPVSAMPVGVADNFALTWRAADTVKIAEYWWKEVLKRKLQLLQDGSTRFADDKDNTNPAPIVQERDVEAIIIKCRLMNGLEWLTKEYIWPGRHIPICTVVGEEIWADGRVVRRGMIRDAKDPQRIYNYTRTAAVEAVAMQPKSPFTATVEQIKGYEPMWNTAGSKNWATLLYNFDGRVPGPPQRVQPPLAMAGLDTQSQIANEDMKGVTGIYDASLGAKGNETSGKAILARQREGDTGTFHFIDNLGTAIEHCGRILVDLIPHYFDTPRVVRTLEEDGEENMVPVNQQFDTGQVDELGKAIMAMHDLTVGEYDVTVVTGPSYATKRQESAATLTELVKSYPPMMGLAGDLLVKSLDIPDADKIAERMQQAAQKPPDPATIAEALNTAAAADLKHAQTAKTLMEADQIAAAMQGMGAHLQALTEMVKAIAQGQPAPQLPPEAGGIPPQMMQFGGEAPPAPPANGPPMAELEPIDQPAA